MKVFYFLMILSWFPVFELWFMIKAKTSSKSQSRLRTQAKERKSTRLRLTGQIVIKSLNANQKFSWSPTQEPTLKSQLKTIRCFLFLRLYNRGLFLFFLFIPLINFFWSKNDCKLRTNKASRERWAAVWLVGGTKGNQKNHSPDRCASLQSGMDSDSSASTAQVQCIMKRFEDDFSENRVKIRHDVIEEDRQRMITKKILGVI